MVSNPNNPEYLEKQCPLPYNGARSGYIRHDVDCNPVDDADDGVTVKQKISDITYRNFNKKYHIPITNGWNDKFIKQVWWDGSAYQEKVGGLSEKYVTQSLFKAWILDDDGNNLSEKVYDPYIAHDVCNSELSVTINISGPEEIITPLGNMFLALESDRDNTVINEERTLAILLEDNTTLYQIDYENDYFVREEGDIALSYESGGLIEPS